MIVGMFTLLVFTQVSAAELKTDKQKFSYALGFQIGQTLVRQGATDVDIDAVTAAIGDVLGDKGLQLSMEEMQAAFEKRRDAAMAERAKQGEGNKKAGAEFRKANAKKPGVTQTASGLQYKVITKGKGAKPIATDTVTVHYVGALIDGTEFDSSKKRGQPATFGLNGVVKGWQEALPMMETGSKWQVVIPPELGYGDQGAGAQIGPNATLVFEIELIEIKKK